MICVLDWKQTIESPIVDWIEDFNNTIMSGLLTKYLGCQVFKLDSVRIRINTSQEPKQALIAMPSRTEGHEREHAYLKTAKNLSVEIDLFLKGMVKISIYIHCLSTLYNLPRQENCSAVYWEWVPTPQRSQCPQTPSPTFKNRFSHWSSCNL